jgi:hypothetical protein
MLYRALPFEFYPLNGNIDVIVPRTGSTARLLPTRMRQALELCRDFRTLEGHSSMTARAASFNRVDRHEQMALLAELLRRKLLVSDEELLQVQRISDGRRRAIANFAIVSSGSPILVRRALESHMQNFRRYDRTIGGIVFDDSTNEDARLVCESLVNEYKNNIRYVGKKEKALYRTLLVEQGIPESVATFTLFGDRTLSGCQTGANRNCSLLDTAGEMFLTVDDDVVCRTARSGTLSPKLLIANEAYPRNRTTFVDRQAAIDAALWSDTDVVAAHEDALGLTLPEFVTQWTSSGGRVDIQSACDHQIADLYLNRGRICATMPGIVGDSGEYSSATLLNDAIRHGLVHSGEYCELALRSKEIVGISPGYSLNHQGTCMAYSLGLDNRELLPPFLPVFRSEDSFFGKLISSCFPGSYWMHLPLAVLHDKQSPGQYCRRADHVRVPELISALILRHSESGLTLSPVSNMEVAGKSLYGVSQLPPMEFSREIDNCIRRELIGRSQSLGKTLADSPEMPEWVKANLQNCRDTIQTKIERSAFDLEDLDHSAGDRLQVVRRIVRSTGELLAYWPQMIAISAELRSSGIRMGLKPD